MMPCKPVYIAHSQPASGIIARNPEKKEPKTPKLYKHIVVVFQYPSTPHPPQKTKKKNKASMISSLILPTVL